jgi:hypothetical protein
MLIEHIGLLSSVRERGAASKSRNHAQDGGTLIEKAISDRRSCHGFWISDGGHPFASHGHLARYAQRPDCHGTFSFGHDVCCFMSVCMVALESRDCGG